MTKRIVLFAAFVTVAAFTPLHGAVADQSTKAPSVPDSAATTALPGELLNVTWQWTWFGSGAEQFDVDHPENYTLQFMADGTAAIQADCNRGTATYTLGEDNRITLTPIAVMMMLCPDPSLEDRFLGALEQVATYFLKDGDFFLELPISSGTLRFQRPATD